MARPKTRTCKADVNITPEMKARIERTAIELNLSKADVLRHAIETYTTMILKESTYLGLY